MSDDKINVVGTNIREKATVIWNVANHLFGYFKPHEYGLVILPMTVVKRFHDCLLPTWRAVQDTYEKVKHLAVIDGFLTQASGYQFYNTSKFNFDKLLADPEKPRAISSTTQASSPLTSCLPTPRISKPTSATILQAFLLTCRTCCPNSILTQ